MSMFGFSGWRRRLLPAIALPGGTGRASFAKGLRASAGPAELPPKAAEPLAARRWPTRISLAQAEEAIEPYRAGGVAAIAISAGGDGDAREGGGLSRTARGRR